MPYSYVVERSWVFTEDGQRMFLAIRDRAKELLKASGAATCDKLTSGQTGDSWDMLACVDRLVELGELREVPNVHGSWGQDRIFIGPRDR